MKPTCPVCLEDYSENKVPFMLNCGHSFCEFCLPHETQRRVSMWDDVQYGMVCHLCKTFSTDSTKNFGLLQVALNTKNVPTNTAPAGNEQITLKVVHLQSGEQKVIKNGICPNNKVKFLKIKISLLSSIPVNHLVVLFKGKILEDTKKLKEVQIQSENTVHYYAKPSKPVATNPSSKIITASPPTLRDFNIINVNVLDMGNSQSYNIENLDLRFHTVKDLKLKLSYLNGIASNQLNLIFKSKPMVNGELLSLYKIQNGSTIHMGPRLMGGS
jgi:hypothetical protein